MFLVSALIGSAVELATGWLMEILFGARRMGLQPSPGSFGRSLNLGFTLLWGALGLGLDALRHASDLPHLVESGLDKARRSDPQRSWHGVHGHQTSPSPSRCFARESARADDLPSRPTSIERCIDEHFPSSWVQKRFENYEHQRLAIALSALSRTLRRSRSCDERTAASSPSPRSLPSTARRTPRTRRPAPLRGRGRMRSMR